MKRKGKKRNMNVQEERLLIEKVIAERYAKHEQRMKEKIALHKQRIETRRSAAAASQPDSFDKDFTPMDESFTLEDDEEFTFEDEAIIEDDQELTSEDDEEFTRKVEQFTLQDENVTDEQVLAAAEEAFELDMLLSGAGSYRSKEYLGPEKEQKTCIWPGGQPISWTELSSGYSWVGVKGTDLACVVSICDALRDRPSGKAQLSCEIVLTDALADMLGDTPFSFRRRIPKSSHAGPVAVVSVAPCFPGHECQQASRAINFLKAKLKDCSSLSSKEAEEIALCTLMYLLGRKFNPKKIEIYGFGKYKGPMGRVSKKHVLRSLKQLKQLVET